jgi:hypothetical protein
VSFKQREAKRKKRAALARGRVPGKPSAAERWWLTLGVRKACCARPECRRIIAEGQEMVYRHAPREVLCVACADRERVFYRPSTRWERSRKVRVRKGPAWMREAGRENG